MPTETRGYVTDVTYTRSVFPELAPAWLDFVAILAGFAPPARQGGFSWCELGCGQGVTTVMMAAMHPRGRFVGVDVLPAHVDHGRRLAEAAKIENAVFHAADVAMTDLEPPCFDYIVAHGVYSWIDAVGQAAIRRLINRHLVPGGLVYLSYNAMPSWATDLPFQRLVRALARSVPGNSQARFFAATDLLRKIADAGAPSLATNTIASTLTELIESYPPAYLVHEYMQANWQPLFVTEIRAAMREIGLVPAGSATLVNNFDSFVLQEAQRGVLATFADDDLREVVRDFFLHQRLRRDVFIRDGERIDDRERRSRLAALRYALDRPASRVEYRATPSRAGQLVFDNPVARGIVAALAGGPARLADLPRGGASRQDLLANLLALCAAGVVQPVEAEDAWVNDLNRAILDRVDGLEEIAAIALPCGKLVRVEQALLRALRDRAPIEDQALAAWLDYIAAYGF
jgi:ubiquinone/menaquinone biosynthesis C-methylase UbiE